MSEKPKNIVALASPRRQRIYDDNISGLESGEIRKVERRKHSIELDYRDKAIRTMERSMSEIVTPMLCMVLVSTTRDQIVNELHSDGSHLVYRGSNVYRENPDSGLFERKQIRAEELSSTLNGWHGPFEADPDMLRPPSDPNIADNDAPYILQVLPFRDGGELDHFHLDADPRVVKMVIEGYNSGTNRAIFAVVGELFAKDEKPTTAFDRLQGTGRLDAGKWEFPRRDDLAQPFRYRDQSTVADMIVDIEGIPFVALRTWAEGTRVLVQNSMIERNEEYSYPPNCNL